MQPIFSVIIPAHDAHHTIINAINSTLQNNSSFEVIISPDDLSDYTYLTTLYPQLNIKILPSAFLKTGPGSTRERGISVAIGKYIAYLDADDIYEPNYLDNALNDLEKYDIFMPSVKYCSDNQIIRTIDNSFTNVYTFAENYCSANIIVKKEKEVGWLDIFSEDIIRNCILLSQNLIKHGHYSFSNKSSYINQLNDKSMCATVEEKSINETYMKILKAVYTKETKFKFDKLSKKTLFDLEYVYKLRLKKSIEYEFYLKHFKDNTLSYHEFVENY